MKTSSRNAYPGKITAIIPGNLSDEVEISLESGEKIYSQVSHACTESLSLTEGKEAVALIKATEIMLVADDSDYAFSCRNQFTGKVVKLVRGFRERRSSHSDPQRSGNQRYRDAGRREPSPSGTRLHRGRHVQVFQRAGGFQEVARPRGLACEKGEGSLPGE